MINTKEIINILPESIISLVNLEKMKGLQEIRIKAGKKTILQLGDQEIITNYIATLEDIRAILQRISNYSIYAYDEEIRQGYITVRGGHRVGICGTCVIEKNTVKTIKDVASLNIRICNEIIGCSNKVFNYIIEGEEILNTIIISPPRCGKTTLLRDLGRNISNGVRSINFSGKKVCVVDERSELASCYNGIPQLEIGLRTDVLDGCPKSEGIMMLIRSMSPEVIICDEIGTTPDMESIIKAANSGVSIITTIHGYGIEDLYAREVFKNIMENNIFSRAVVLSNKEGVGTIDYIYDFKQKNHIYRG
ncbi:stage III sporulation protein AA [uncultured Clostridium sp.]|uniref:stage III sporulation protein AA n=1 Tax=uncultured Clostridium sp. TaxID=59620 RepID=UPI0028EFE5C4|nr:stage III sporulation protein AA [uncultured Clostridium sp.]